jgi:NADH dehydrogenase/NADH:ubiquinone oxidoreductase subunit G
MADETFQLVVDGRATEGRAGETLLTVCRRLGKDIPTLCHHEAMEPYAACRVCLVEVAAEGKSGLVASCQYPASRGLDVRTNSQAVQQTRRLVLELLLARCPSSEVIQKLAAKYGVTETPYSTDDPDETCIVCGLCTRVCEEVLKISAIGFASRGVDRRVGAPFEEASDVCIGCGACVAICPTGHVRSIDDGPLRRMQTWNTDMDLARCQSCGRPFAPLRQLEHIRPILPEHVPLEHLCPNCRRSQTVARMAKEGAEAEVYTQTPSPAVVKQEQER